MFRFLDGDRDSLVISRGNVMDDSNASKEDIKLGKKPKAEEQRNVDAKPPDEPRNVVPPPPPKIDFRIQFTTATKFDNRAQMLKWVSDLALEL
ncbi:hypothetical protein A2U01_0001743, partial [Trifolium medium]|nr:hypothetical protein [Trifolium medium]